MGVQHIRADLIDDFFQAPGGCTHLSEFTRDRQLTERWRCRCGTVEMPAVDLFFPRGIEGVFRRCQVDGLPSPPSLRTEDSHGAEDITAM